ncbi:MAG: protein kinase [Deltaproteobacteria bacterium]|nr:protein kinase [Deltaproteobacteria bacterium]
MTELYGAYLLHHRLAEGATSEVFLGQTTGDFPRICAIKRIRPEIATLPEFDTRFREDAQLLMRLIHGNLVQILEVGSVEEQPFIAMEYIDGVDLAELVATSEERGELPPETALHIALEMSEAVKYLRQRRQQNHEEEAEPADRAWPLEVMLSFDGVVKLVDLGSFGALHLRKQPAARLMRSPGWGLPEAILNQPLDTRSDVFTVGRVLWELFEGRSLFAEDPEAFIKTVIDGTFEAPPLERKDVPVSTLRLVGKMLALDPKDRPSSLEQTREELVSSLRRISAGYGATNLERLLVHRLPDRVGQVNALVEDVGHQVRTAPTPVAGHSHTLSFGLAGKADRKVATPASLKPGNRIPGTRYRVVSRLGAGGSAQVFRAQHVDLDRQVAIKILNPELAAHSTLISQFRMEARACSRIGHPNIVDVIDFGELTDGRFFFAMELVEGRSLADIMSEHPLVPAERALPIMRQVAKALQAAHDHHIIHRDLKPENIMLTEKDGRTDVVKVLDFGVSAFTSEQEADRVGTPGYMSPEQVRGHLPTPQMDIYALGTTLYEMLCGRLPYPAAKFEEYVAQQNSGPPPALRSQASGQDIHPALERAIHRALERDPEARPPSCADFEADLIVAQREAGIVTEWDDLPPPTDLADERRRPPSLETPPVSRDEFIGSSPLRLWFAVGAVLCVAGGVVWAIWHGGDERAKPPLTTPQKAVSTEPAAPSAEAKKIAGLVVAAERAAALGEFTQPGPTSAYDHVLALEKLQMGGAPARKLRHRFADILAGMAKRLAEAGFRPSARILYREAAFFLPASANLRELAAFPAAQPLGPTDRPQPKGTRVAFLAAQIHMAVARGDFLRPPKRNAFYYLRQLRKIDPSGTQVEEIKTALMDEARATAGKLLKAGEKEQAHQIYHELAKLQPEKPTPGPRASSRPAKPSQTTVLKPGSPAAVKELLRGGLAQLRNGRVAAARAKLQQAYRLAPHDAGVLRALARVNFDAGSYEKAFSFAFRASRAAPRNLQGYLLLGDANFALGRKVDARKAWQAAHRIAPKSRAVSRRLERLESP